MAKRLLVASVYAPCERNQTWLANQLRFLGEYTQASFDLAVYLNRVSDDLFQRDGVYVIDRSDTPQENMCKEHAFALNQIIKHFVSKLDQYDHFLILDSDAFPCADNWLERLIAWMREDDFLPERLYAAACRAENLDTFPHPCCFFMKGAFLKQFAGVIDFRVAPHVNLSGFRFEDVGCGIPTSIAGQPIWLPLLRTNSWNPHPVLGAIYGGMFYHHGAGSRPLELRSVALRTYDTVFPRFQHGDIERQLYLEISRNPKIFVKQLTGK